MSPPPARDVVNAKPPPRGTRAELAPALGAAAQPAPPRRAAAVNLRHANKRTRRRRNTIAAAVWSCALVTFAAAVSGAGDGGASDWERPSSACEPACRSGYECRRGECTPVCSPPCEDGYLCSADGGCIS